MSSFAHFFFVFFSFLLISKYSLKIISMKINSSNLWLIVHFTNVFYHTQKFLIIMWKTIIIFLLGLYFLS